jgi:hypothetical protein
MEARVGDNDGFYYGTPVVEGSDNFTVIVPPQCDSAKDNWNFFVDPSGIGPNDAYYLSSGARVSFISRVNKDVVLGLTRAIFGQSSIKVPAGGRADISITTAAILQGGTVVCPDLGKGDRTTIDIVVCPV